MPEKGAIRLGALLSDPVFKVEHWRRSHVVWQKAVNPDDFISRIEVDRRLDASLLKWPYFSMLRRGEALPVRDYTSKRDVIGQVKDGFPNARRIRHLMTEGATLKLNNLADWHRPIREVRCTIEAILPVAVASYVFWTPRESQGMLPHRDAAHVLAIQLEGYKEWALYADPEQIAPHAGLDVNTSSPSHKLTLGPGDVLYLPHGWPHSASARESQSIHLTFTLTEPTPNDLLEAVLERFIEEYSDLVRRHHIYDLENKSKAVRQALASKVIQLDEDEWLDTALFNMRKTTS